MTKVSIITPLYNKEAYVAETIQSVLKQTMTSWEMIIVENGSTDNGPEVVKKFSDPRIRLAVSPKLGPGASRNYGLNHAKGEWVLFLDADDLLVPDFLEKRLLSDYEHNYPDIIVGGWEEFGENKLERVIMRPDGEKNRASLDVSSIFAAPWAIHAALVRRKKLTKDPWPEKFDKLLSEDTVFWFSIIRKSHIIYIDENGALYRVPNGETRNRPKQLGKWVDAVEALVSENMAVLKTDQESITRAHTEFIMRGFEFIYRSVKDADKPASIKALKLSKKWLSQCQPLSITIILRKIMGVYLYCEVRDLIKRSFL